MGSHTAQECCQQQNRRWSAERVNVRASSLGTSPRAFAVLGSIRGDGSHFGLSVTETWKKAGSVLGSARWRRETKRSKQHVNRRLPDAHDLKTR